MPPSPYVIPFFMVFGGSTMGVRRQFVLLGCSKVCVVRHVSSRESVVNVFPVHGAGQSPLDSSRLSGMAMHYLSAGFPGDDIRSRDHMALPT
jgi:hypothetical protein